MGTMEVWLYVIAWWAAIAFACACWSWLWGKLPPRAQDILYGVILFGITILIAWAWWTWCTDDLEDALVFGIVGFGGLACVWYGYTSIMWRQWKGLPIKHGDGVFSVWY